MTDRSIRQSYIRPSFIRLLAITASVLTLTWVSGWLGPVSAASTAASFQVLSSADDVTEDGGLYDPSGTLWVGNGGSASQSYTGLRFTNVNIPQGATISSAHLEVMPSSSSWIGLDFTIAAEAVGNSSAFSAGLRPSQRQLTAQKVRHSSNTQWNAAWISLDEIAPVIQEVVRRPDWRAGNSLTVILQGAGGTWARKHVHSSESSSSEAPRLMVTYDAGQSAAPTATSSPASTSTPIPAQTSIPVSAATSTLVSSGGSGTSTTQVAGASDDVNEDGGAYSDAGPVWLGNAGSSSASYAGLRFTNVNVPRGAVITSARLEVMPSESAWIGLDFSIAAEAAGNSQAFSPASRPSQRVLTSQQVSHSSNSNWSGGAWVPLNEMAPVIQQVISRSDWQPGNSVSVILRGTGGTWARKQAQSFDTAPQSAPKLVISYSGGTGSGPISTPVVNATPTTGPSAPLTPTPAATVGSTVTPTPTTTAGGPPSPVVNLLPNGDFESSFSNWTADSAYTINASDVHGGQRAARLQGRGNLTTTLRTTPGKSYKVTFWAKVNSSTSCSGDCWGYFNARLDNWGGLSSSNAPASKLLMPSTTATDVWQEYAFTFTPGPNDATQGNLVIGSFSGSGWSWDVLVDDIQFFENNGQNSPPGLSLGANPRMVTNMDSPVQFSSQGVDGDGVIAYNFWRFGDGGRSNLADPTHRYSSNGTYKVELLVYDDGGSATSKETTVTVADSSYPTMEVTSPSADNVSIFNPSLSVSGTASPGSNGPISRVIWSTDRGQSGTASGTTNWSFNLDLTDQGGPSRVTINAIDASGRMARRDLVVDYRPSSTIGITGVTQSSSLVEQYEKLEVSFSLSNGVFTNPNVPYETDLPPGMKADAGVTVNAHFTSPSGQHYTQPAFLYQPFQRNTGTRQLLAEGTPVWKVRFAPDELGEWRYVLEATDDSGTATSSSASSQRFTVTAPTNPNNHGFISVAGADSRYFEFSDGKPFIGVGPGPWVAPSSFQTDAHIADVGSGNSNFGRPWMSGSNIAGTSWAPWSGGIPYVDNFPGTSLTTDEAYGDGIFSFTLPQPDNASSRCAFYGFHQPDTASVKSNTNYQVMVRLKTVGVTGSGGFTFRPLGPTSFPNGCDDFASQPTVIPHVSGTTDWHVVTGSWNSGSHTKVGYALATLERVTGGRVFVDEISIREDLGGGRLGPEVLPRSKFNVHEYFSQEPSWNWDYGLDAMAAAGAYQKIVISEKGDYAFHHIAPSGFGYAPGEQMQILGGASHRYQQYYWRYLTARYGYSRAVHSWEFVNEDPPGNMYFANEMAKYMHSIDPHKHLVTTSFWCCLESAGNYFWKDPGFQDLDYADLHIYVNPQSTDPATGANLFNDTGVFISATSISAFNVDAAGGKPLVIGEAGLGVPEDPRVAGDTRGIWAHHLLWSQLNEGGAYVLYWYPDNLKRHGLWPLFGIFRQFMEGGQAIPINNGRYADIGLSLPPGFRGWGQKDVANRRAHFWVYDREFTWTSPSGGAPVGGKTVSFDGMPAGQYTVELWDTWTGGRTTQTLSHPGGVMSLTIPPNVTSKDIAVKIYP